MEIDTFDSQLRQDCRRDLHSAFRRGVSKVRMQRRLQDALATMEGIEDDSEASKALNEIYNYAFNHGLAWEQISEIDSDSGRWDSPNLVTCGRSCLEVYGYEDGHVRAVVTIDDSNRTFVNGVEF